jgi:hypothetical protein
MRNALISIAAGVAIFMLGVFILNAQLWYSSRADSLAGARYAIKNINAILQEARHAAQTAMSLTGKACDIDGQYRLGTEAALQPHLRTLFILRQDRVWCSSLPGNRVLLKSAATLPVAPLLLLPANRTVDGLPVLISQTNAADGRIVVTISDRHLRDALDIPLKDVDYALKVGTDLLGMSGDVVSSTDRQHYVLHVSAVEYRKTG